MLPPAYPVEYYYPEFIESRSDDPRRPPPPPPPLSTLVIATTNVEQLTNRPKKPRKKLVIDIVVDHGLPDVDINQSARTDPKKSLIRNPLEKNVPRLIIDENVLKQSIRRPTISIKNLDDNENILNDHINENLPKKIKPIESIKKPPQQHQAVKIIEDKQPINEYWKKEILIDDEGVVAIEPVTYDKNTYEGPFGLTRKGSFIFYFGMSIFTLLAGAFLIMTGIFYSRSYPDSSGNTGKLAGIGVCGFSFYLGFQLILIGIWHQKYRQENPVKKTSTVHNESTDHLKSSMENNEQYDYSYQQPIDYAPYGYYSNPPYTNEQMLLQQPGAATGVGLYDTVVWPSNVEIETQPDPKFLQPMEWSLGEQQPSTVNKISPIEKHTSRKKTKNKPTKTVIAEPIIAEFDNLRFNSNTVEQTLPDLSKAPETMELIQSIAQMEQNTMKSPASSKKKNRIQPLDNKTDVSSSVNHDENHHHHHRRHHHRQHSHRPHHHRHRSHRSHNHHQRRHHHHRPRSYSPCSQCSYYSHEYHRDHTYDRHDTYDRHHTYDHHHSHSVGLPRIIAPRFPKIITPSPPKIITPSLPKINPPMYREIGINTGSETKIMRDSSVTADLEDIPNIENDRLQQIPVVRRTIIVEPYPGQPTSQIIVKPRIDMTGKIRLGKNINVNNDNETIVYPSTAFLTRNKKKSEKKKKKRKKSTIVNDNIIEDLQLEDINDDDDDDDDNLSIKIRNTSSSTRKTIKNAFYN